METPKRYHPLLVTLHWLVAILVLLNLYIGLYVFLDRGLGFEAINSYVPVHMLTGLSILALVVVRFLARIRSKRPAEAKSGSKALDVLAKAVHYGLYVMLIATTLLGLTFALQSNRFQETFLGAQPRFGQPGAGFAPARGTPFANGTPGQGPFAFGTPGQGPFAFGTPGARPFPGGAPGRGFSGGRPRGGFFGLMTVHLSSAYVLLFLVILHILAALYHQFIRRDGLIARMWYGVQ
jgi:cytochrome b561